MSKTRLQMRTDLRLDLKDSGSTWSDNELNRCIERAVSDFSRFLPRQRIYEESLQFTVTSESVTMPKDTDGSAIVNTEDISASTAGSTATIDGQPDVPRPLRVQIIDANNSITGLTVIVIGTDEDDIAVQETFSYIKGDSKQMYGVQYFKNVYSVEIDQIAGNGSGDVLEVGYGTYTDVWVSLANKPVKWESETSVTDGDSNAIVRDTDFYIDYLNGRIKAISGGDIVAEDTVTISYIKQQTHIDLSSLKDLIRVEHIEYPIGQVPQNYVPFDIWGKLAIVTGGGEMDEQERMREDQIVRVYYYAQHQQPSEYSGGTLPVFLENTVLLAASSYALFIYAVKQEIQCETDLTAARTSLTAANTAHTALGTALANIKKYLDNNTAADAAGILQDITDDVAALRTAISTALDAANAYLDAVATDLANADGVRASYLTTTNYVDGGTEPDIKTYLASGDALLNTVTLGGENEKTAETYALYAQTVKNSLVAAHEQDRTFYLDDAQTRANAALGYTQEATQRLSTLRSYIEQAEGYTAVANTFAREAEARITEINSYLQQAAQYAEAAGGDLVLADRFRDEAETRRSEAWGIWRDRNQYIGDPVSGSIRQPGGGTRNS